jgi:alpha-tubulin suppressor-like RCC1 family protein/lysophospholipase L1-like esterase
VVLPAAILAVWVTLLSVPVARADGMTSNQRVTLAAGSADHACAVRISGTVSCWGVNGNGQLGDGTLVNSAVPVPVSGLSDAIAVSAGHAHSCAVKVSRTVVCWGLNNRGQLGNGTTTDSSVPVVVFGLSDATEVTAGDQESCAVRSGGAVVCWGLNVYGELGDGTTTDSSVPVTVSGLSGVTAVASFAGHSCALTSSGTVECWGLGPLGNGTTNQSVVPVTVAGLSGVTAIAAGSEHFCAMKASGAVVCWGSNLQGQLGDGTTTDSLVPVAVTGLSGARAITAGFEHSCALTSSESVVCWGYNGAGQLGDGDTTDSVLPVQVSNLTDVTAIAGGANYSCALKSAGTIACWGSDLNGALGDGTPGPAPVPVPVSVSGLSDVAQPVSSVTPVIPNLSGGGVDDGRFVYVALGDSYSAGVGTEPNRTDKVQDPCYRTETAYPFLIADELFDRAQHGGEPVDFTFAACGGARVRHVTSTGQLKSDSNWAIIPTPDRPQIDYVPPNADLITLTIGGNDIGFSGVGAYCFAVAECDKKLKAAANGTDPMAVLVDSLEDDLIDTFVALREKAPHATIMVIGYPTLLSNYSSAKRYTCPTAYSQLEKDEVAWIQGLNTRLNGVLARAAAAAGVRFFDLAQQEAGGERHGMCGDQAYINVPKLKTSDSDNTLHPNSDGHAAYARAILASGVLDLPRNPDATGTRPSIVQGPPVHIEFMKVTPGDVLTGIESSLPTNGDAVAGVGGTDALVCVLLRSENACKYAVRVVDAKSGTPWHAWVYSDPTELMSGTVGPDGTIDMTLDVSSSVGGGAHSLVVEVTSASGEQSIFVQPVQLVDYVPLAAPVRLLDTRAGQTTIDGQYAAVGTLGAGQVIEVPVAGRGGVADDAASVVMNLTAADTQAAGYATVFPCGEPVPNASNVNYVAGQNVPNAVVSRVGAGGKVCVFTYAASDFIIDVSGYYTSLTGMTPLAAPVRLLDTRAGQTTIDGQYAAVGTLGAGQVIEVPVAGRGGVADDAASVVMNLTAADTQAAGYATVFPCGEPVPNASNVNYVAGQNVPNAVVSRVGAGGKVCVFTYAASDFIIDVSGYIE